MPWERETKQATPLALPPRSSIKCPGYDSLLKAIYSWGLNHCLFAHSDLSSPIIDKPYTENTHW